MQYHTYVENLFVKENTFIAAEREDAPLPTFGEAREILPEPFWAGHANAIDCYWKAWEIGFRNLMQPTPESGFVANFIDTAFNGCLFMWDSAFILMFGRYGSRAFNFQRTLDNFYAKQNKDGFISREIQESDGEERLPRFDPSSTGPNVMPWTEWEYFLNFGDRDRLARVFPALVAYHQWLRAYHTWPDGTYWGTGWFTGMDNQPRLPPDEAPAGWALAWYHGHMSWIDVTLQQILSCHLHLAMAKVLGREKDVEDFRLEAERLTRIVNETMWDEATDFYYDRYRDGSLNFCKSIGAFWALLANTLPQEKLPRFVEHLRNPREFNRPHRVPSLSADHADYNPAGEYWRGSIWPNTNYMVLRGLTRVGEDDLAHEIARNHHDNVVKVFEKTGTVFENYAPEDAAPGDPAKSDFVGWSGLGPITVLLEYVIGLRPDVPANKLVWDVRLLEEHGVSRYPFGAKGMLDLRCAARASASEKPVIHASSNVPLALEVRWGDGCIETMSCGG